MNPFDHMSISHNVWPILLSINNLLHGFATKGNMWWYQLSSQDRINQAMTLPCIWDHWWMIWKHYGQKVCRFTTHTRDNHSQYIAYCSPPSLIYLVAVLCLWSWKGKRIASLCRWYLVSLAQQLTKAGVLTTSTLPSSIPCVSRHETTVWQQERSRGRTKAFDWGRW